MSKSEDAKSDCGKGTSQLSKELLNIHSDGVPAALRLNKKNNNDADSLQDGTQKKTFKFQPSSALLRAKDFLPQMATANASLEERLKTEPQSAIDIENTDGFSGPVIEMNMALVEAGSSSDSESDLEDSSCDDSCEDISSQPALLGEVTEHNMRLTKDTGKIDHKPKIEVLDTCNSQPKTAAVSDTKETNSSQMHIPAAVMQERTKQEDNT